MPNDLTTVLVNELIDAHPSSIVDAATRFLHAHASVERTVVWLTGYGMRTLHATDGSDRSVPIAGSIQGRAILDAAPVCTADAVYVPIVARSHVIGVLECSPDPGLDARRWSALADVIGSHLYLAGDHSDKMKRFRGAGELSVAATIQYDLLPTLSYAGEGIEVAGRVEPATEIAGDAFDYAIDSDSVELAIFDATGHGLNASLLTLAAVGAYRRSRRKGRSGAGAAADVESTTSSVAADGSFVAGVLVHVDLCDYRATVVNAGHLRPLLVRDGAVNPVGSIGQNLPFGLSAEPRSAESVALQRGDVLALYTDGVIEARDPDQADFGTARLATLLGSGTAESRSVERLAEGIIDAVIDHVGGGLRDDATLILLRV